MTAATAQDRLRQIAILVSSVDATAARQILLHLPSDTARQVRAMASQIGAISPEEKRRILAEFQRSAATSSKSEMVPKTAQVKQISAARDSWQASDSVAPTSKAANYWEEPSQDREKSAHAAAAWTRLSTTALVRFVRGESPAITAVVISQLPPHVAVDVLQSLSADISRDVMLRLSRLQDIAPEAMAEIDEHLSQRLHEYEHRRESELENSRRIDALLQAAPESLRRQWASDLGVASPQVDSERLATPVVDSVASPVASAQDMLELAGEEDASQTDRDSQQVNGQVEESSDEDGATILAFAAKADKHHNQVDRSLIELEFEQILVLPPPTLAALLSSTDSQTVLLALAGATPQFMRRFYRMLDRSDAKILQNRLQRIGAIQMRDIDEAQRRIVEHAARLVDNGTNFTRRAA